MAGCLGCCPVEDPVEIHDLDATILQLLDPDHEQPAHCFQGQEFRMTDVSGHVIRELL